MSGPTAHHLIRAELHAHCGINMPVDQCTDGCASAATLLVAELRKHGHLGPDVARIKAVALDDIAMLVVDPDRDGLHEIYPHQVVERVAGLVGQVAGFEQRIEGAQRTLADRFAAQVREAWLAARTARGMHDAGLPPLRVEAMLAELQTAAGLAGERLVAAEPAPAPAAEPVAPNVAAAYALLSTALEVIGPQEPRPVIGTEAWDEQSRISREVAKQALIHLRAACGG